MRLEDHLDEGAWLRPRARTLVLVAVAAFCLPVILDAGGRFLSQVIPEGATGVARLRGSAGRFLLLSFADWTCQIPGILAIAWLSFHSPLERRHLGSSLLRHALAVPCLALTQQVIQQTTAVGANALLIGWGPARELFAQTPYRMMAAGMCWFPMFYLQIAAIAYALKYWGRLREQHRQALGLERQLVHSHLQMLRMQLNPHFIFNTLNTITALQREDLDMAERMLLSLTAFLRSTLEERAAVEVPLRKELALAEQYLEIEKIRFLGRVALELDIDPGTLDIAVPSFTLQPLVENAIRHGLTPRARGGTIRIRAGFEGQQFLLVVEDDGLGDQRNARSAPRHGLGLENLRERLAQRYGTEATLAAGARPEGGFRVELRLPREAPPLMDPLPEPAKGPRP